jgi:hypothetical protein
VSLRTRFYSNRTCLYLDLVRKLVTWSVSYLNALYLPHRLISVE